jgi:hypothetical protein
VPLAEAGLDQGEGARRDGPAVDAAHHSGPLEDGEVAADGLGGDPELLGHGGHRQPSSFGDEGGDGVLTLLGVHGDHLPPEL